MRNGSLRDGNVRKGIRFAALIVMLAMVMTGIFQPGNVVRAEETSGDKGYEEIATPGDADGIYKDADGYCYYYVSGQKVEKSGWLQMSKSQCIKLDSGFKVIVQTRDQDGRTAVTTYDKTGEKFIPYVNVTIVLMDGKMYFAGADGFIETAEGIFSAGDSVQYAVEDGGEVTAKLVKSGDVVKYYRYVEKSKKWKLVKNKVMTAGGAKFVVGAGGKVTKKYSLSENKLYIYSSSGIALVKNSVSTIDGSSAYYFGSDGTCITAPGWYTLKKGTQILVGDDGCVSSKIVSSGRLKRYYVYNGQTLKWEKGTKVWVSFGKYDYYFTSSGKAKYAYNTSTGRLYVYSDGTFVFCRNRVVALKDGKPYYFNKKGKKYTKSGWKNLDKKTKIRIGSKGYVTLKKSRTSKKLYKYNYTKKKWNRLRCTTYKMNGKTYKVYSVDSILTKNPCYTEGRKIKVKGLMLHSVGEPQVDASVYVKAWNSASYSRACVHAFIDGLDGKVYQTLPWNHRGWHCGASGNNAYIGVEMCEPDCIQYVSGSTLTCSDNERAKKIVTRTYNAAVKLFAQLCIKYDLDPLEDGVIISHNEGGIRGVASTHVDPEHLWKQLKTGYTMDTFRNAVAAKVKQIKGK